MGTAGGQGDRNGGLTFVGTATTIIRFGGITLLTDPNFLHRGQRAYLGYEMSSARRSEPAVSIDELPELTAIVLSHLHGDHWDRVHWRGFPRATGLRTWTPNVLTAGSASVRITSLPDRHAPGSDSPAFRR